MSRAKDAAILGGAVAGTLVAGFTGGTVGRFYRDRRRAEAEWERAAAAPLDELGTVDRLSVLPLIDWYTSLPELEGESGVSYLVRADETTILFDLGYNNENREPSPLLRNMETLGVDPEQIDMVVVSHAHVDHTGGLRAQKAKTFFISPERDWIGHVPAYIPEPRTHPAASVETVREPLALAPGVATTGAIPRALWLMGLVREQALLVNVAGKGVVAIVGCGHQGAGRLLERIHAITDEPLYGFIGGLHLPVTGSRMAFGAQRFMGTGKLPWSPVNKADARAAAELLAGEEPGLVSLSPHDSCDWSVELFRETFGDAYEELLVGREITVEGLRPAGA